MEKKNKTSIVIGFTSLLLVTLLLTGLTYAYYRTRIIENTSNNPSISVQSKWMEITYSDETPVLNMKGLIEPGFEFKKDFSVKNTGDSVVNYGVYLEDLVNEFTRTSDWKLTLICSSDIANKACAGKSLDFFPKIESLLATNTIEVGETQTYTLKIEYLYLDENQSVDMGKQLSAKIQIYDLTNTLKENTLASMIINNALSETGSTRFRNVPLSIPAQESTTIQAKKIGAEKTYTPKADYYYAYASEVEFNALSGYTLVDPQFDKYSDIINNPTKLANFKYTREIKGSDSNAGERTETIKDTFQIISASLSQIVYQELALTPTNDNVEKTLSVTRDDYGISYYYRGNVDDNYITYNGMCWKIVRILGDGSVKLILEDSNEVCSTEMDRVFRILDRDRFYGADYNETLNYYVADYLEPSYMPGDSMRDLLNDWLETQKFDINDLKKGDWCLGNLTDAYKFSYPYDKYEKLDNEDIIGSLIENKEQFLYESYYRLYRKYPETALLTCENGVKANDYIGTLSMDEVTFAGEKNGFTSFNNYLTNSQSGNWYLLTQIYPNIKTKSNIRVAQFKSFTGENVGTATISSYDIYSNGPTYRPSIVLNNSVMYKSGNGTIGNPYIVE